LGAGDLTRAIGQCDTLGFEPVVLPHVEERHGYFAGPDASRLADLNAALADPRLDAIWCLRGGSGLTRLVRRLDGEGFRRAPKPVIGYSDITALLLSLHAATRVVTIHGPTARSVLTPFSREHLRRILTEAAPMGLLEPPGPPASCVVPGRARGRLLGGNLAVLQTLIGTRWFPSLNGAILFLEDVGEALYRIDRMLAHLELAGHLDRLGGLALGAFTAMPDDADARGRTVADVAAEYLAPRGIPVAFGFPFGHIADQWTLPIGVEAELDADAGTLTLLGAAVDDRR
jgi:muramoyltetrapeptide carboxypeptidase